MGNKYKLLAAVLFAAGAICLAYCFTHNNTPHLNELSQLSGVLMIWGLLLFLKSQKKADEDTDLKSYGDTKDLSGSSANETIAKCEKILSDIRQYTYGDEDDGEEEISFTSQKLGKFIYRRKPEWYEASCDWCGSEIKVTLGIQEYDVTDEFIRKLEMIFENQNETDRILRKMACEKLDEIKDKRKCPDDLLNTKSSDFAKRLVPCNLCFITDEGFSIYYGDDITKSDLSVLGHLSNEGSINRVEIENAVTGKRI